MKLENYYLNMTKIDKLNLEDRKIIHDYYRDMIYAYQDGRLQITESLFNTLYYNEFLCDVRDKKIEEVLHENISISS